jgi:hypothetical protein
MLLQMPCYTQITPCVRPTAEHTCVLCTLAMRCIRALPEPQASVGPSYVASYDGMRARCLSTRTKRMTVCVEPHSAAVAALECYCSATL